MSDIMYGICVIWFSISAVTCSIFCEWIYIRKALEEIFTFTKKLYHNKNCFGYLITSLAILFLLPGAIFNLFVSLVINVFIFIWKLGIKK